MDMCRDAFRSERVRGCSANLTPVMVLIQLVFLALWTLKVVAWPLVWVLSPLWIIPAVTALVAGLCAVALELLAIAEGVAMICGGWRR